MIIAKYPLPTTVKISGFSFTRDIGLGNRASFTTHNVMKFNRRYIYIHKHQFFNVDETQIYRYYTKWDELYEPHGSQGFPLSSLHDPNNLCVGRRNHCVG